MNLKCHWFGPAVGRMMGKMSAKGRMSKCYTSLRTLLHRDGSLPLAGVDKGQEGYVCWSNTDNKTGLGLSPLNLPASVTQSQSGGPCSAAFCWGN